MVRLHESRWQESGGNNAVQSSVHAWEHVKPKGRWIKVSADYRVLDAMMKEKKVRG